MAITKTIRILNSFDNVYLDLEQDGSISLCFQTHKANHKISQTDPDFDYRRQNNVSFEYLKELRDGLDSFIKTLEQY